jgi:hypothetical protein
MDVPTSEVDSISLAGVGEEEEGRGKEERILSLSAALLHS